MAVSKVLGYLPQLFRPLTVGQHFTSFICEVDRL